MRALAGNFPAPLAAAGYGEERASQGAPDRAAAALASGGTIAGPRR